MSYFRAASTAAVARLTLQPLKRRNDGTTSSSSSTACYEVGDEVGGADCRFLWLVVVVLFRYSLERGANTLPSISLNLTRLDINRLRPSS